MRTPFQVGSLLLHPKWRPFEILLWLGLWFLILLHCYLYHICLHWQEGRHLLLGQCFPLHNVFFVQEIGERSSPTHGCFLLDSSLMNCSPKGMCPFLHKLGVLSTYYPRWKLWSLGWYSKMLPGLWSSLLSPWQRLKFLMYSRTLHKGDLWWTTEWLFSTSNVMYSSTKQELVQINVGS